MTADNVTSDAVEAPAAPLLSVVRGNPSDEQVAALLAVLVAASSAADSAPEQDSRPRELWGDVSERLRINPPGSPSAFTNDARWR